MTHRILTTDTAVTVGHSHPEEIYGGDISPAQKAAIQTNALTSYPGIQPVYYTHLDHSDEELLPTRRYNCWGFTFNPRQCWINSGTDVQNILDGNGTQVFAPNIRVGDVICYRDSASVITHTGRVWAVNAAGEASLIQSKWGNWGEYIHPPLTVPSIYGTDVTYWRVTPLHGKGDAWHMDNTADDRLPYPPGVKWLSPDLWCNNSGGVTHQDPVRGVPNQLYARLHNADSLPINNATIHFYWADPNGGIPHAQWHDIGSATVSVPTEGGAAVAGPVSWTPDSGVPDHSCLLAIADTGDDYHAAATLDPIVWPFDISRDNNVVQRNIAVVAMPSPGPFPPPLPFKALNPNPVPMPVDVRVNINRVEPQDLDILMLDLKDYVADFEDAIKHPIPTPPTLQVKAKGIAAIVYFFKNLLRLVLRFFGLATPKSLELEINTTGALKRSSIQRLSSSAVLMQTNPVEYGKGGDLKLQLKPGKGLRRGQTYRIDIEQRVAGAVTGGMTYIVIVSDKVTAKWNG